MITEEEKKQLKAEILADLREKGFMNEDTQSILAGTRKKWFGSSNTKGKMHEVFDSYTAFQIWDFVRKLTCRTCGVKYVRNLYGKEEIAKSVAETLCQTVYNSRKWSLDPNSEID